ncbi:hypothetical protein T440DRAFT_316049 [Plenodomus tracheiphilus IPT5]|uniref:Secreted protein n=1 Tax=Plenodomus tracheiphilus IPT5 TaxID=1408161 RepID=A0A6A7AP60_9PLEO|nr:hypothetical protein T440DRAFT_316049 [Plenodomus tracheiphilus IPT5]
MRRYGYASACLRWLVVCVGAKSRTGYYSGRVGLLGTIRLQQGRMARLIRWHARYCHACLDWRPESAHLCLSSSAGMGRARPQYEPRICRPWYLEHDSRGDGCSAQSFRRYTSSSHEGSLLMQHRCTQTRDSSTVLEADALKQPLSRFSRLPSSSSRFASCPMCRPYRPRLSCFSLALS